MRWIAGVACVAAALVGACIYASMPYDSCPKTKGQSFSKVFVDFVDSNVGGQLVLNDLAPFDWDRVLVFPAYTPASTVKEQTGQFYLGNPLFGEVPEGAALFSFMRGNRETCRLSWGRGWVATPGVVGEFSREQAVFRVEKTDEFTSPHLVPDAA